VPGKMLALKPHDVSNQELLSLGGHFNEPSMQPVRTNVMGFDEIHPKDLDRGFENDLVGETHRESEDVLRFIAGVHYDADAPATEIDGSFNEFRLGVVRPGLKAHGQHDIDSIMGAAIGEGRWGVERHKSTHYSSIPEEMKTLLPLLDHLVRQLVWVVARMCRTDVCEQTPTLLDPFTQPSCNILPLQPFNGHPYDL
jgi:hypothetical protein